MAHVLFRNIGDRFHHAYGVVGDREPALREVLSFIEKVLHVQTRANPDCGVFESDTYTIERARDLSYAASLRPIGDGKRVFVFAANFFTIEAQNALLKTIEEPAAETHFFLVVPALERLIPTLRSRLHIIFAQEKGGAEEGAQKFLRNSIQKRLEIVKKLCEEISDDTRSRQEAVSLIDGLEEFFADQNKERASDVGFFTDIFRARRLLAGRGASVKMILEHLAVVLPRTYKS